MRNGVYLVLILFLGVMGYHIIERSLIREEYLQGGLFFLILSLAIAFFTTNFKKSVKLVPIQKIINIIYISIFAVYGVITGISILYLSSASSALGVEGFVFLIASGVLLFSLYRFFNRTNKRKKISNNKYN